MFPYLFERLESIEDRFSCWTCLFSHAEEVVHHCINEIHRWTEISIMPSKVGMQLWTYFVRAAVSSSSVTVIVIVDDEFSSWVLARTGGSADDWLLDGANSISGVGSVSGATGEKDKLRRLSLSLRKQSTRMTDWLSWVIS